MRACALVALLLLAGCDEGAETGAAAQLSEVGESPATPSDPRSVCETHADCRVLSGVCGSPTPVNAEHVREMERMIEVRGRHRSCSAEVIAASDTTAACVSGACVALLGPPTEHRCESDEDCVVAEGLCGPTEAVSVSAREAFADRVDALLRRHVRCGYGRVDTSISAACEGGYCVPER